MKYAQWTETHLKNEQVWNNNSFGSEQANKDMSYTVLLHGFGITNSSTARIKVWGNCDKQMSPVKMSRGSHSLGLSLFGLMT